MNYVLRVFFWLLSAMVLLTVPVFFGSIVTIAALFAIQALWFLGGSWLTALVATLLLVLGCVYYHHGHMAWMLEPTTLVLHYYHSLKSITNFHVLKGTIEKVVSQNWKWFGDYRLWETHILVGLCVGSGVVLLLRFFSSGLIWRKKRAERRKLLPKPIKKTKESRRQQDKPLEEGTVLGLDTQGNAVELTDKEANQHTLVLGTTGAGKTVTVCNVVESAIARGIPVIYIDGKGDDALAQKVIAHAKEHGRMGQLFSMREKSMSYNPLASGGFTSKKDRIVELREWTEEHYKKLAEGYLQAVFKIMDSCQVPCNLSTLAAHMDLKLLQGLVRKHANHLQEPEKLMDELSYQEQASKSIESLIAEIRNFSSSEIGCLFEINDKKPVLTIDEVLKQKGVAYFSLPALEFPSMAQTLGKLIINDLKATVAKHWNDGLASKVYVIFDEFSVFAGEQVLNVINMGRSAGIHAILSTQSLSDIAAAKLHNADHFVNQILGNCNNFILHRQNSPEDAEMLARVIGTRNTIEYTMQMKDSDSTHTGTVKHVKGFITHPDEIKRLGTGEAFVLSKSKEKLNKVQIRKGAISC